MKIKRRLKKPMKLVIALFVFCFVVIILKFSPLLDECADKYDSLFKLFELLLSLVAAYFVYKELKDNERVQEAQFALTQNQVFIENNKLHKVEEQLTRLDDNAKYNVAEFFAKERQSLINYLVYLEGLASEVLDGVISLEEIDDVFSYRYFAAMNCKYIQWKELKGNELYYLSCIRLYDEWYKFRSKKLERYDNKQKKFPFQSTPLYFIDDYEKIADIDVNYKKTEKIIVKKGCFERAVLVKKEGKYKLNRFSKKRFQKTAEGLKVVLVKTLYGITNGAQVEFEDQDIEELYNNYCQYKNTLLV
ncbi:MAG: hypothetical protein J6R45_01600 [Clostridia bacterium]|nr:hypothetical protein [Clostridia bacterium]